MIRESSMVYKAFSSILNSFIGYVYFIPVLCFPYYIEYLMNKLVLMGSCYESRSRFVVSILPPNTSISEQSVLN